MNNSEQEIWKDIPGYEGLYQASSLGKIKSILRKEKSLHPKTKKIFIRTRNEKFLRFSLDKDGYLKVRPCKNGKPKMFSVHKLILLTFKPNLNNLPQINHINGIKTDNHINNLEWCDHSHNMKHSYANNLHKIANKQGENSPVSILTEKQVLEIRRLWSFGEYNQKQLSEKFNTEQSNISRIVNNIYWKHI